MRSKKTLFATTAVVAVALTGLVGVGAAVRAESGTTARTSLIDKLAAKFNLDKTEVQAVFDEERATREAERTARRAELLQEKVADGTITAEQKSALEVKLQALDAAREALHEQDASSEEVREQMKRARDELKAWAEEQDIDLNEVLPHARHGHGGMMHRGLEDGQSL